jgi:GNAT superfamily N-acetyltransferase
VVDLTAVDDEIRPARPGELPLLQDIERAAGRPFAEIGMTAIAEDEPPSPATLEEYRRDGRAWVAGDPPYAYLLYRWVDGNLHIEQVSVHPDRAGRGIGRALIEHVAARAGTPVTLTTFTDVPWNAPYYERLGFRRVADGELTPAMRAIRAEEAAHGLDRWPRVVMRRESPA